MSLPLHPMFVHLPLALALILPVAAAGALWIGRRRPDPRTPWRLAVALFAVLAVSAWAAVQTGERDEEAVERLVPEAALQRHEARADLFLYLAWAAAGIAAVGLLQGSAGRMARYTAVGVSVLLVVSAFQVGHAGAELVYRHGAAQAHLGSSASPGPSLDRLGHRAKDHDDD